MTVFNIIVNITLLVGTFIIVWYARKTLKESRDALQKLVHTLIELFSIGGEYDSSVAEGDADYSDEKSGLDSAFHAALSNASADLATTCVTAILQALESIERAITESASQPNAQPSNPNPGA